MTIPLGALDPSVQGLLAGSDFTFGMGERIYCAASGSAALDFLKYKRPSKNVQLTLAAAYAQAVSGRNDTIILSPDAHTQTASLTWAKNMTHLVGAYGPAMMNQRARIAIGAAYTPVMTISGYGNTFHNVYFMHDYGNAACLVNVAITGARNSFINCHFIAADGTAMDETGYRCVTINNSEQYFKNCFFGGDAATQSAGSLLQLGTTGDGGPPRCIFEDCLFVMDGDAAGNFFIDASLAGLGNGLAVFKRCHFINLGTALTYAIKGDGLSNFQLFFDSNCTFGGATDVVAVTYESYVLCGGINMAINQVNTASVKLFNMLCTNPDVS